MPLKTNYKNIAWNGLRKYQLIQNQDGTVSFLDVTEYTNVQDAKVLANDLNTNNDLVNRIMAGEFFYTEAESDALLALKQNVLSFDDAPTANSDNPVKSGGIKAALDLINSRIDNLKVFAIHVCQSGEYDPDTLVPTIQNPDTETFYLVPSGTGSDVFTEWIYINNRWEIFGSSQIDMSNYVTVADLQDALDDKQDVLTFDNVPTANSQNPVKSGGVKTALDGKSNTGHDHDDRYYTESETDILLSGKSDTGHDHDERYYTEQEVDVLLNDKRNVSDSYTKTEVDTLLSAKSDNIHNHDNSYYKKEEVDELIDEIELTPGPQGPKGDTGDTGPQGPKGETGSAGTYYVKGTQTASTNAWTGKLPEVDALYDGLGIDYFLPFAGTSSAATLNLTLKDGTKTGAIPVYRDGANTFTNNVGANQIIRLIYHSVTISGTVRTGWRIIRTQDNNDAANRIYNGSAAYQANSAVYRYQLLFQVDENKLTALNNVNNSQATNKTMLTGVDFLPFGKIFYYNSTTNVAANGNMTSALNNRANFDLRYSLNSGTTLTAHRDIYLKCVKQSNGKFRITADPCWTQSLPSTADGYYYLRLGRTYSTSNMYLDEDHPIYYHDGTALRFYTDPAKAVPFAALTGNPTDNSALSTALAGKAAADHNHDGAYAAKSHNHDDLYYTESEINSKLAAKQDTLTFDSAPKASSTNPVTSGGVKTALDGKVNKSGDTMTGNFGIQKSSDPSINFTQSDISKGGIFFRDNIFYFFEYPADQQSYRENYSLPSPDSELTATKWYRILTSKDNGIYFYANQNISVGTSQQLLRIPSSGTWNSITTNTVVLSCVFQFPDHIVGDVTWQSYDGYITFTGTCIAATTATVIIGQKIN